MQRNPLQPVGRILRQWNGPSLAGGAGEFEEVTRMLNDRSFQPGHMDLPEKEELSVVEKPNEGEGLPEPEDQPVVSVELQQVQDGFRKGQSKYVLTYGSKRVDMYFGVGMSGMSVDTYVENVEGAEKIPDETSELYRRVAELCQSLADANQKTVRYVFKTQYPQLARWALSKGDDVFHWDRKSTFNDPGGEGKILSEAEEFVAIKKFFPRTTVQSAEMIA